MTSLYGFYTFILVVIFSEGTSGGRKEDCQNSSYIEKSSVTCILWCWLRSVLQASWGE